MDVKPFGDCLIETVMRWEYREVTEDMRKELKKEGGRCCSQGGFDRRLLDRGRAGHFPLQRRRDGFGAQMDQ